MQIIDKTISLTRKNRPGTRYDKTSITIHETDNVSNGADALAHANYIAKTDNKVSWHYTVDDTNIVRHIPEDEIAWHSGTADGNCYSIGIEICVNADGDFDKALSNTAELVRNIMYRYGFTTDDIKQHFDWNKKDCPKRLRKSGWADFIELCKGGSNMYTKVLKPTEISKIKLVRALNGKTEACASVKSRTGADIVLNAAAYNMTNFQVDGALTIDNKAYGTGRAGLGFAFKDNIYKWNYLNGLKYPDFIGGFGLLLQNGEVKITNPMPDKNGRTALGITADGELVIMVIGKEDFNACNTDELAQKMRQLNCVNAINLDGSYSSQVIAPNHTIASARAVNNYICIWLNKSQTAPVAPQAMYSAKCTQKVQTLGPDGKAEDGRYIAIGDLCKIYTSILPGLLIKVDYPTSSGMRTAYVKTLEYFKL